MQYCKVLRLTLFALMSVGVSSVWAEAPVVDINSMGSGQTTTHYYKAEPASQAQPAPQAVSRQDLTEAQRLTRLEQQQDNLANMNLPEQIAHLQEQLAELRGQVQVQEHNLKTLQDQQRGFYQDLDQRLAALQKGGVSQNAHTASADSADASSGDQLKDSEAYQAAFNLLEKKQYTPSQTAFNRYLQQYPNGAYVSNTHYWLGEIYMAQKNTKSAVKEFNKVIRDYPKSNKVPDAKLKLAIIHGNMGKTAKAKQELVAIQQQYPKSTAARLAGLRLQQLSE